MGEVTISADRDLTRFSSGGGQGQGAGACCEAEDRGHVAVVEVDDGAPGDHAAAPVDDERVRAAVGAVAADPEVCSRAHSAVLAQQLNCAVIEPVIHPATDPALATWRLRAVTHAHLLGDNGVDQSPQPIRVVDPATRAE